MCQCIHTLVLRIGARAPTITLSMHFRMQRIPYW